MLTILYSFCKELLVADIVQLNRTTIFSLIVHEMKNFIYSSVLFYDFVQYKCGNELY